MQKLWNAVDHRVRLLHDVYSLSDLERRLGWRSGKPSMMEVLGRLGLVRPLALEELKSIRNLVEHADRGAPNQSDCLRFVELVWYFLRSTDLFAGRVATDVEWEDWVMGERASTFFLAVELPTSSWELHVRGRFPQEGVSDDAVTGHLELRLDQAPRTHEADTIYSSGHLVGPREVLRAIVDDYFLLDLPDHRGQNQRPSDP